MPVPRQTGSELSWARGHAAGRCPGHRTAAGVCGVVVEAPLHTGMLGAVAWWALMAGLLPELKELFTCF